MLPLLLRLSLLLLLLLLLLLPRVQLLLPPLGDGRVRGGIGRGSDAVILVTEAAVAAEPSSVAEDAAAATALVFGRWA